MALHYFQTFCGGHPCILSSYRSLIYINIFQLPEQDLMNYYTVVPEMSHKDSELQVLITNATFTWNGVSIQDEQQKDKRKAPSSSPTGTHTQLIDSQSESSDDEALLPALRRINMQLSKVKKIVQHF